MGENNQILFGGKLVTLLKWLPVAKLIMCLGVLASETFPSSSLFPALYVLALAP